MTFERDSLRHEARKGIASTLVFWPKADGVGNVQVSAASATVYDHAGNALAGPTALVPVLVSGVHRLDVAVPAVDELQENGSAVITYTPDGAQHPGEDIERVHTVLFDVVLQPWGDSTVSLNDLQSRFPTIIGWLKRMVDILDPNGTDGLTAAELASRKAHEAHAMLYVWIRNKLRLERSTRGLMGYLRPRLIVDRLRLHPIEVELTLHTIFEGNISESAEGRDAAVLADRTLDKAKQKFAGLGDLEYDSNEDRVVDQAVESLSKSVPARRIRGR